MKLDSPGSGSLVKSQHHTKEMVRLPSTEPKYDNYFGRLLGITTYHNWNVNFWTDSNYVFFLV